MKEKTKNKFGRKIIKNIRKFLDKCDDYKEFYGLIDAMTRYLVCHGDFEEDHILEIHDIFENLLSEFAENEKAIFDLEELEHLDHESEVF